MKMIITGNLAEYVLKHILNDFDDKTKRYRTPSIVGYFKEGDRYTCFDNSTSNCWVEQAKSKEIAIKWCLGEIDAEELYA